MKTRWSGVTLLIFLWLVSVAIAADWWQADYDSAMVLVQQGDLDAAQNIFEGLLKKDKRLAKAHYGLGLVYARMQPANPQDARLHLRSAVKNEPRFMDAWIELAELESRFWSQEAVNVYARALKEMPENDYLQLRFIQSALRHRNEDKVVETFTDIIKDHPRDGRPLFYLASAYFFFDRLDKSIETLDTLKSRDPKFSPCKRYLLRAKIHYDRHEDDKGAIYYMAAINAITDSSEAKAFLDDLCFIMNDAEYELYQSTPAQDKWKFIHQFWRSRDPNRATREYERAAEHYRRLAEAYRKYPRYAENPWDFERVYESDNPSEMNYFMGERLLSQTFLPHALSGARPIDDYGLIYIRHGEPDLFVTSREVIPSYIDKENQSEPGLGAVADVGETSETTDYSDRYFQNPTAKSSLDKEPPLNMSVKYFANSERGEMIFHFKKYGAEMGWIIENLPTLIDNREALDTKYAQLGLEMYGAAPNNRLIEDFTRQFADVAEEDVRVGLKTETGKYRFESEPLSFPFSMLTFKGAEGKSNIELYYVISGRDVELSEKQMNLQQFVGLYDLSWNEHVRIQRPIKRTVDMLPEQWKSQAFVDVAAFPATPGDYTFELHLEDKVSGRLGVYRGDFDVPDFGGDSLKVSDVLISGPIALADENSVFRRGDISYTPHMFNAFTAGEEVGIYFELYNLKFDAEGKTSFRVTCTLQPYGTSDPSVGRKVTGLFKNLFSSDQGRVGSSYDYSGAAADEGIYLNFDLAEESSGRYEIVIDVLDLITNEQAKGKVEIEIK